MTTLRRLYTADAPLTVTGVLMVAALIPALAGLWLDPRLITGAPAWLKPAKFAVSTAIYTLTLAWIFTYLPEWIRTRRIVGWATAVILIVEVGAHLPPGLARYNEPLQRRARRSMPRCSQRWGWHRDPDCSRWSPSAVALWRQRFAMPHLAGRCGSG